MSENKHRRLERKRGQIFHKKIGDPQLLNDIEKICNVNRSTIWANIALILEAMIAFSGGLQGD